MSTANEPLSLWNSLGRMSAFFSAALVIFFVGALAGYFGNTSGLWSHPHPEDLFSFRAVFAGTTLFLINLLCWNAVVFLHLQNPNTQRRQIWLRSLRGRLTILSLVLLKVIVLTSIIYALVNMNGIEVLSFMFAFIGCLFVGSITMALTKRG